jgi:hypothetical protein
LLALTLGTVSVSRPTLDDVFLAAIGGRMVESGQRTAEEERTPETTPGSGPGQLAAAINKAEPIGALLLVAVAAGMSWASATSSVVAVSTSAAPCTRSLRARAMYAGGVNPAPDRTRR